MAWQSVEESFTCQVRSNFNTTSIPHHTTPHPPTSSSSSSSSIPTTMPPKKSTSGATPSPAKAQQQHQQPSSKSQTSKSSSEPSLRNPQDAQQILLQIYNNYLSRTPQRVKLLDAFMFFLMGVGLIQFVYCVLAGNYVSPAILSFHPYLPHAWSIQSLLANVDCLNVALQRLPSRLQRNRRPIRPHGFPASPDESG